MLQTHYRRQKNTAVSVLFHQKFVPEISTFVIDEFCGSYATLDDIKSTWRANLDYTKELSDLLVIQTRTFLRLLDSKNQDYKKPSFLQALTKLMADYLSAYFMRDSRFPTRNKAKEYLERVFYDDNPYIINLLKELSIKRAQRQKKEALFKSCPVKKLNTVQLKNATAKFVEMNKAKKRSLSNDYIK